MKPSAIAGRVDDYLNACRARGLSPKTVKESYGYPLRGIFVPWCEREGIAEVAVLKDERVLDRFTTRLLEGGGVRGPLSKHAVHSYTRAVNGFLSWLARKGEVDKGTRAQTPRLPRKLVDILERHEIAAMEDVLRTERDKLILRVLADGGLREEELAKLRISSLVERQRNGFVHVEGKGAKDRLVPLPRLFPRLRRYAEHSRPSGSSDRIFLSHRQRAGVYQPLTPSGIYQVVKTAADLAGITKRAYPHLLRHSFATWYLSRGGDPITLAQILGHESLTMIQKVYAHLAPSDSFAVMARVLEE